MRRSTLIILFVIVGLVIGTSLAAKEYRARHADDDEGSEEESGSGMPWWWPGILGCAPSDAALPFTGPGTSGAYDTCPDTALRAMSASAVSS